MNMITKIGLILLALSAVGAAKYYLTPREAEVVEEVADEFINLETGIELPRKKLDHMDMIITPSYLMNEVNHVDSQ